MEILLALGVISALCSGCSLVLLLRKNHPAAEDDLPWEPEAPEPEDKALRMDQGFENLMAYQVSLGRGKTTGGEA